MPFHISLLSFHVFTPLPQVKCTPLHRYACALDYKKIPENWLWASVCTDLETGYGHLYALTLEKMKP